MYLFSVFQSLTMKLHCIIVCRVLSAASRETRRVERKHTKRCVQFVYVFSYMDHAKKNNIRLKEEQKNVNDVERYHNKSRQTKIQSRPRSNRLLRRLPNKLPQLGSIFMAALAFFSTSIGSCDVLQYSVFSVFCLQSTCCDRHVYFRVFVFGHRINEFHTLSERTNE